MKYVLVTGACGGMGRCCTELLLSKGYTVFALDKNTFEEKEGIIPICADITDTESILNAYNEVCKITDELFAIIHFAGIYMLDSFAEVKEEELRKIFDVNFFGAVGINKIFLPLLKKGSRIIITTSELAPLDPLPFTGIYALTKAALDKYAYSLAMELQLLDIRVSVLRAGAVATDMLAVSTDALEIFCNKTGLYKCNSKRFKTIVGRVEARNITPRKLSEKAIKILLKQHPKFTYSINRNPLLLLLNFLPKQLQLWIIKRVLK
ncbi:MAG: SDR family NAD(P)-dependent oxidoreductase [Clostridia bacterium]|nr:SDR family NAD(P)-dependent oxidoreductase [Clostridia bacterium]